ncbi:MAG: hypothetical protein H0U71_07020 [Gammaproteobacteria bacterium]|nr:hypothetical protein [Gammaproteobacteria bacterium]
MSLQELTVTRSPTHLFKKMRSSFKKSKIRFSHWFVRTMDISNRELDPAPTFLNKIGDFILKPFINKDSMSQILMGQFSFQAFKVGYDLGLFNYLNDHPGSSLDDIARQLKTAHYPTEILLVGLAGLKLIKKIDDLYYNSAIAMIMTQKSANKFTNFYPKYMQYAHNVLSHGIQYLQESVVQNKPVGLHKMFGPQATDFYYELSKNEVANQHFVQHMSAFSEINAQRVASLPIFSKLTHLWQRTLLQCRSNYGLDENHRFY